MHVHRNGLAPAGAQRIDMGRPQRRRRDRTLRQRADSERGGQRRLRARQRHARQRLVRLPQHAPEAGQSLRRGRHSGGMADAIGKRRGGHGRLRQNGVPALQSRAGDRVNIA